MWQWKRHSRQFTAFLEDTEPKQLLNNTAKGCDGTIVSTGHNNGVISLMEKEIGRPFTVANLFVLW